MNDELHPNARRMLALAQRAERRLPRDRRRVLQGVLAATAAPLLTAAAPASSAAGSATSSTVLTAKKAALTAVMRSSLVKWVTVATLGTSLGYVAMDAARSEVRPPPASHAQLAPSSHVRHEHAAAATVLPREPSGLDVQTPAVSAEKRAPQPTEPQRARTVKRSSSALGQETAKRETQDSKVAAAPAPQPALPAGDPPVEAAGAPAKPPSLAADLKALRRAQRALVSGDAEDALSTLDSVTGPSLLAERTALSVFALCALGRVSDAREKAALFFKLAPESPLRPRVEASCGGARPAR